MPERGSTLGEKAHEALQEPVIALRDATAALGSRPVLRGVDLTVHRGEVVALLGANGSGKSTAVRSVIGQVPLTGGSVELFGTELRRFRRWDRIGYVPQRTTAAGGVPATIREVVASGCPVRGCGGRVRRTGRPWTAPSSWWASPTARRTP